MSIYMYRSFSIILISNNEYIYGEKDRSTNVLVFGPMGWVPNYYQIEGYFSFLVMTVWVP